jgi:O-antigen/teichoic acid export membrane protein
VNAPGVGPAAVRGGLLARNTLLNIGGQLVPIGIGVATLPYVVGGLGESRFGVLALAWTALGYFGVMDLGMGRAATRYIAEALGRGEPHRIPGLLGTALAAQVAFGVVTAAALALAAPVLAGHVLNVPTGLLAETTGAFYLIALALPVVMVTTSVRGALEAAQRFDLINAVTIPAGSASFLLPVIGVALGWSLAGIVGLLFAGRAVTLVALVLVALPAVPGLQPPEGGGLRRLRLCADRRSLRQMLGFGGWIMVSNLCIPLLSHLERFLIPVLLTVGALTYYAVPFEVLSRAAIIPAAMALTLFPAFSFIGRDDGAALDQLLARPIKYLLFVMTPLSVFLWLFAQPLLGAWLGEEFAVHATAPLRILVAVFYLNSFAQVALAALHGLGRPDLKARLDLVQVPLFVALLVLLIPRWGVAGAAVAKLVVTVIDMGALFVFVGVVHRSTAERRYPAPLRRAAGLSLLLVVLALPLLLAPATAAFLSFVALVLVFLAAFWRASIDQTDRAAIFGLLRRVWRAAA